MLDDKDRRGTAGFSWIGKRPVRPDGMDKVTGKARYGADYDLPGQLWGRMLRAPHPHARLLRIDTSRAAALEGVKAVVTGADFPDIPADAPKVAGMPVSARDHARNTIARDKVLYDGHPVAAIAATSRALAEEALQLIEVEYAPLPHVIGVEDAAAPGAPILHPDLVTKGADPSTAGTSNVVSESRLTRGDAGAGFARADVVVERRFTTEAVHQGYIEPHACLARVSGDGKAELWTTTQGAWVARAYCAAILGWDIADLRVTSTEIGGGFGGKINVYEEPIALRLSQLTGRPVKMTMTREEVFRCTGPTSASVTTMKIGATADGSIIAAEGRVGLQAGAFPGAPVGAALQCAFAPYTVPNLDLSGYEVVSNRPSVQAYRAPGAPIAAFAVESLIDELAQKLNMDPIDLRLKNAVDEGDPDPSGKAYGPIGLIPALKAAKASAHWTAPLPPGQGRGVAAGYWFNIGGATAVNCLLNEDGTVSLVAGTADIGGLRASLTQMTAETLGIDFDRITTVIGDTAQLGFNLHTGGSRATFASGQAAHQAATAMIEEVCRRAARLWDIPEDAVIYENGAVRPAGPNAGAHEPLTLAQIAGQFTSTGGPITGSAQSMAPGSAPSFGVQIMDVALDAETGKAEVTRCTAIADAGRAIHPSYVEGQFQGGATQGIGWALNEAYVYGPDGRLQNPGFLDYRIPVASDLPMIDTQIIEVPNPGHPYGVRGVGEIAIVPALPAVANAVSRAAGRRITAAPMSPPALLEVLDRD